MQLAGDRGALLWLWDPPACPTQRVPLLHLTANMGGVQLFHILTNFYYFTFKLKNLYRSQWV